MSTRIVLVGGFLGAGKTTLINKAAASLSEKGRKVAIINNDQGEALVDTQFSKGNGFKTSEVLHGCFCCRFPDFLMNAQTLVVDYRPDIILAEPVGSCTDLQATVLAPLRIIYPKEFAVAPLMVLVDSSRLSSDETEAKSIGGYLRKHQIEEAEVVLLSKVDMISPARLEEIKAEIKKVNSKAKIIAYSAVTSEGLEEILKLITSTKRSSGAPVDVNYDTYADAEAELGWYNGFVKFDAKKLDSYDLGTKVLKCILKDYSPQDIAHAKVMIRSPKSAMKMSLIFSNLTTDQVKGSRYADGETEFFINGRVVSSPEKLRKSIRNAVKESMSEMGIEKYEFTDDCFSPGRPNPTYRMTGKEAISS